MNPSSWLFAVIILTPLLGHAFSGGLPLTLVSLFFCLCIAELVYEDMTTICSIRLFLFVHSTQCIQSHSIQPSVASQSHIE